MIFSFVFHFLVLRLACCGVVEREYEHMLEKRGLYVDNLFQYLPKNCRGADSHELQDKGDSVDRCLEAILGEKLPFDCKTIHELHYDDKEPFAQGTKKAAFFATFRGQPVVVKKPREALIHGESPHVTAFDFRNEALVMAALRSRFHTRLLGHCSYPAINVVERLRPWRDAIPSHHLNMTQRLKIAHDLVDLLEHWTSTSFGSVVHCDFYSFQFALDENDAVKVVDLDGLMPIPFGDTRVCNGSCEHNCYRGAKYDAVRYGVFQPPRESFACGYDNKCLGYREEFNIFLICRILFYELFMITNPSSKLSDDMRSNLLELTNECGDPEPSKRPSLRRIRAKLDRLRPRE